MKSEVLPTRIRQFVAYSSPRIFPNRLIAHECTTNYRRGLSLEAARYRACAPRIVSLLASLDGDRLSADMNPLHSRREFLAGAAAIGASIIFPSGRTLGQSSTPRTGRIDVHHHFGSPAFVAMTNTKKSQGYQIWQPYTPSRAIEDMDRGGVSTAMISITTPGIWFGNLEETRRLARQENEYGARMVSDYKGRFGLFAVLPLPDVDASLREIEYAYDTLKAEGVGLLSNWRDQWLGDESFKPVLD